MDARTGEVLKATNADTRLYPASLTKMMTLYIAFQAVEHGEISLDDMVRVSRNAATEAPSKLGLREGQKIKLRYLIRAAAIKSANDAATAIGEAIAGSENAFADRMNRTAQQLGMTRTTFRNANGLTLEGHLSTARDMTTLGRHLYFDYPEYYHLFSTVTADVGGKQVYNTNRKFLAAYQGADGIKTGYTVAAGFNLVASAQRGNKRIIATIFGGRSTAWRNEKMAELLDYGFAHTSNTVRVVAPAKPAYLGSYAPVLADASGGMAAKTIRLNGAPPRSLRPRLRPGDPGSGAPAPAGPALEDMLVASATESGELDDVAAKALAFAADPDVASDVPDPAEEAVAAVTAAPGPVLTALKPMARPDDLLIDPNSVAEVSYQAEVESQVDADAVITRTADSGPANWGVNVGRYTTEYRAERVLLTTALSEVETLEGANRKVVRSPTGFDANFDGLTREAADRTCRRLSARNVTCFMIGPGT